MIVVLPGVAAAAPGASAAVFTSAPPEVVVEGEGPLVWSFASDAPGTMWGAVTWRLSTEPEWHMCGGAEGSATLPAPPAGTYWVEVADEIDLTFAAGPLGVAPFTRCSEPHQPALGPLRPVALSAVTPAAAAPAAAPASEFATATAMTTVSVVGCRVDDTHREALRAAIHADRRRLQAMPTTATARARRGHLRRRLARERAARRALACP